MVSFYTRPSGPDGMAQGVGMIAQAYTQKKAREQKQEAEQARQVSFNKSIQSQDPADVAAHFAKYPDDEKSWNSALGIIDENQRTDARDHSMELLNILNRGEDPTGLLTQRAEYLESQGRSAEDTRGLIGQSPEEQRQAVMATLGANATADEIKHWQDLGQLPQPTKPMTEAQKSSGGLAERKFLYQQKQDARQHTLEISKLDKKSNLDTKDILSVNKDVNKIASKAQDVDAAYKSIVGLSGVNNPVSQVAAVIKLIKSLDPTSTVTQGEQNTISGSSGAYQGLINKFNKFTGKGGVGDKNWDDIIATAGSLSDTARKSGKAKIDDFLKVVKGKVTPEDYDKWSSILQRKPSKEALAYLEENKDNPETIDMFEQEYGYRPQGY